MKHDDPRRMVQDPEKGDFVLPCAEHNDPLNKIVYLRILILHYYSLFFLSFLKFPGI